MQKWKKWLLSFLAIVVALGSGYVVIRYYSYVFAKSVEGRVVGVKREDRYEESYVVAIRTNNGEIYTTHSEDAQWALVRVGQCARAKYFPHPPWNFQDSGTYFGAKLLNLRDCTEEDGIWDPDKYCPGGSQSLDAIPQARPNRPPEDRGMNEGQDGQSSPFEDPNAPANPGSEPGEKSNPPMDSDPMKKDEDSNFQRIRERYLEGPADT